MRTTPTGHTVAHVGLTASTVSCTPALLRATTSSTSMMAAASLSPLQRRSCSSLSKARQEGVALPRGAGCGCPGGGASGSSSACGPEGGSACVAVFSVRAVERMPLLLRALACRHEDVEWAAGWAPSPQRRRRRTAATPTLGGLQRWCTPS